MSNISGRADIVEDLEEDMNLGQLQAKRPKIDEQNEVLHDKKLDAFLNWCKERGVFIDYDKVKITSRGTSNNYGMIAVKEIQTDEILSRIPKTAILNPFTTQIKDLIVNSTNFVNNFNQGCTQKFLEILKNF